MGRDHWFDQGVDGIITLKWTLDVKESLGRTGFGWLRLGSSSEFFIHGNEPSAFIRKAGYSL
jgi:hypothetical protein